MKTRMAIGAVLCALFVAVPNATPKGKPGTQGLTLSVICNEVLPDTGTDFCSVTGSGMTGKGTYGVGIADSCSGIPIYNSSVNVPGFNVSFFLSDSSDCPGRTVSAVLTLTTHGKVAVVQTASASI